MANERNALKAGIFIVTVVVLAIAVIVGIQGLEKFTQPTVMRSVRFELSDDLGGLRVGDDVRVGGFKVGVVRSIELVSDANDPHHQPKIVVLFSMPDKYVIRQDAHIAIQGTVTGTSWLNFDSLGSGDALAADQPLAGRPGTMTQLVNALREITPQVQAVLADVRTRTVPLVNDTLSRYGKTADEAGGLLAEFRQRMPAMVEKYNVVADRAAEMMVQVRDLIGDTKGDFRGTMANLNAATGDIKTKLPVLLDQVNKTMVDLQSTVAHTRDLAASARNIVVGNRGKFDGMIVSLKTTADNLKAASAEIRRSPWRLLYKPGPGEMANLNLFDAARQFSEGASSLNDATLALRDALNNPEIGKEEIQKLMEKVDQSFSHFQEVESKLWKSVEK
ncbi:MAG: MCE family protein [Phycisphaerales bacterium]|jgi:phospholipid/cholesterol/gamma-HCH transport system substrate-binding protein|nr:MCE family protein [Phycisphaerales bacterium]